jgi:phage terminase large subunit-like protein
LPSQTLAETCKNQTYQISLPPSGVLLDAGGERISIGRLRTLDVDTRAAFLASVPAEQKAALLENWWFMARPEQLFPAGDHWSFWLYLAGRGAGKSRVGAETVRELVKRGYKRMGLIAPTAADARDVMVEGESGVLSVCSSTDFDYRGFYVGRPTYESSKRRLTWGNGAQAFLYSADEPERLRGPQHEFLWADELASWRYAEAWDLAMFGLRLGPHPRAFISTTPKPKALLKSLMADPNCVVTRGSTYDNRANLAPQFFAQVVTKYEGTRLGRQELDGDLLLESEDALWNRELIDTTRVSHTALPPFKYIVVAVDPAVTSGTASDLTGIVVVGLGVDNHGYALSDYSGKFSPAGWAARVDKAYTTWQADAVVAESNQGGELVRLCIHSVNRQLPVRLVHASRGKYARAEPVAALFEQNRAHIVGSLPHLEDQMCTWEPRGNVGSPDRLDAMVWGMTDCLLGKGETGQGALEGAY